MKHTENDKLKEFFNQNTSSHPSKTPDGEWLEIRQKMNSQVSSSNSFWSSWRLPLAASVTGVMAVAIWWASPQPSTTPPLTDSEIVLMLEELTYPAEDQEVAGEHYLELLN